jgi:hypothetical protein
MLKPLLIIGVGGSGGKTIRAMKESLSRKLLQAGYLEGLPTAWQFLQVDTTYDGLDFNAPMLPQDETCIVVPPGATFGTILEGLTSKCTTPEDAADLFAGWAIPRSDMDVTKGAGMIRGIGRQVGIAEAKKIRNSLQTSVSKMLSPVVSSELLAIAKALRLNDPDKSISSEPSVILITSLSGGSGAGMFMDVAEILKRTYRDKGWAQNIVSFLYTAEVFEGIQGAGDVRQNCLGALNEIVAGRYRQPSARTNSLMTRLTIQESSPTTSFIGSQGNILIGSKNQMGVDLSQDASGVGMNEVFLTIGETLAGVVSNPGIADWVYKTAFVNATTSTKVKDESGLSSNDPATVLAFASMGFGRLSLGVDRVMRYVADALTRSQIDKLLWPENVAADALQKQTKDEILLSKLEFEWDSFLAGSQLNEREDKNELTDRLVSKEFDKHLSVFVSSSVESLSTLEKPQPINRVAAKLWNDYEMSRDDFLKATKEDRLVSADTWAKEIQKSFLDYSASYVSNFGLKLTSELIGKLVQEIREVADHDLAKEIKSAENLVGKVKQEWWLNQITEYAGGRQGLSKTDREVQENIETLLGKIIRKTEEIQRKKLAQQLLRDFADEFLEKLQKDLAVEFTLLKARRESKNPEDNGGIILENFPHIGMDKSVPKAYLPRAIEKILIDPKDFLDFYKTYARAELTDKSQDPFQVSVSESLLRRPLRNDEKKDQTFIAATSWAPRSLESTNNRPVEFTLSTDFRTLQKENQKWLVRAGSEFAKVSSMSIREYCFASGDKKLQNDREAVFLKAYTEMMKISVPLVSFNQNSMRTLKNPQGSSPTAMQMKTERIPFAPDSPIGTNLIGVLTRDMGVDTADQSFGQQWFDGTSNVQEMFAIQVPEGPMPAYAFASLTNPIAESVLEARSSSILWANYWNNRRSRPLLESIPVTEKMLHSIITGWYVAEVFGLISEENTATTRTLRIANPTLTPSGYSSFPAPMLQGSVEDVRNGFKLPSVLTSIGLAMVNYGQTGDASHLNAYRLLKYLGREVTVSLRKDDWDNGGIGDLLPDGTPSQCNILTNWILNGTFPEIPGLLLAPDAGPAGADASQQRRDSIREFFKTQTEQSAKYWEEHRTTDWQNLPDLWELRNEMTNAFNDIRDFVQQVSGNQVQGFRG